MDAPSSSHTGCLKRSRKKKSMDSQSLQMDKALLPSSVQMFTNFLKLKASYILFQGCLSYRSGAWQLLDNLDLSSRNGGPPFLWGSPWKMAILPTGHPLVLLFIRRDVLSSCNHSSYGLAFGPLTIKSYSHNGPPPLSPFIPRILTFQSSFLENCCSSNGVHWSGVNTTNEIVCLRCPQRYYISGKEGEENPYYDSCWQMAGFLLAEYGELKNHERVGCAGIWRRLLQGTHLTEVGKSVHFLCLCQGFWGPPLHKLQLRTKVGANSGKLGPQAK